MNERCLPMSACQYISACLCEANLYPSLPMHAEVYIYTVCMCTAHVFMSASVFVPVCVHALCLYVCMCISVQAVSMYLYIYTSVFRRLQTGCTLDQSGDAASNAKGLEILIAATIPLPPTPISKAIPRVRRMMRCKRSKCASRFTGPGVSLTCSCKHLVSLSFSCIAKPEYYIPICEHDQCIIEQDQVHWTVVTLADQRELSSHYMTELLPRAV